MFLVLIIKNSFYKVMEGQEIEQNPTNYIYNSTKIYRNNYPIDIDVDTICEELYSNAGNRQTFEEIMKKVENDILTAEVSRKAKKEDKYPKQNMYYSASDAFNGNKYSFRTTLPEGELMKEPVYQSNIMHKKYTDVNANSKFYYPSKNLSIMREENNFQNQWTNRANKIILDSQNNWSNKLKTPKSTNQYSPNYLSPGSPVSNNTYNPRISSPNH